MSYAPVAADLDKPLDVEIYLAPQIALNHMLFINDLAEAVDLVLSEIPYLDIWVDAGSSKDLPAQSRPYAVDIAQ